MTKEAALHSFFNSGITPQTRPFPTPKQGNFLSASAMEVYKSPVMVGLSGSSVGHLGVRVLHTRKIQLLREDT